MLIQAGHQPEARQVLAMLKEQEYFAFIRRDPAADPTRTRADYNPFEAEQLAAYAAGSRDPARLGRDYRALTKRDPFALSPEQEVIYENPSGFRRGLNHPVERVSWDEAQRFVRKLNARGREAFRLPSEAEWEYACRSGGKAEPYCGGEDPDTLAWFSGNSQETPQAGGSKAANGLGLHDMSGNVWERVQDCYRDSYHGTPAGGAAREGADCAWRVFRGGSWATYARPLRATSRLRHKRDFTSDDLGFRLVRSP